MIETVMTEDYWFKQYKRKEEQLRKEKFAKLCSLSKRIFIGTSFVLISVFAWKLLHDGTFAALFIPIGGYLMITPDIKL